MTYAIPDILETLACRESLSPDAADAAFGWLMDGQLTPAQAGALLIGLRTKGETPAEMAAAVRAVVARARTVEGLSEPRIDVVGTGGDKSSSFNCSTAVNLCLAAMGYVVVKHGNRAISSACGSADAIEALGLPMPSTPEGVAEELARHNFAFLFAPSFHPSFKHIMPLRRELGVRTLFNLLGPLVNPARPTHQLLGVARPEIMNLMAEVLLLTGVRKAAVVHGQGGLDELTPFGPAQVVWVGDGKLVRTELDPAELGIATCAPEDIVVRDKDEAVSALRAILGGKGPAGMREMLVFNLAVAVHLLEEDAGLVECVRRSRALVKSGQALRYVEAAAA